MTTPSVVDVDKTVWASLSSPQSPTMPTHQAGDLLFGFVSGTYLSNGNLILSGTGWTLISHVNEVVQFHNDNKIMSAIFYKIAASGSETAPQISMDMAAASDVIVYLYSIRNVDTTTWTKGAASVSYQGFVTGTYQQKNILPEAKNLLLIHYAIVNDGTAITTTTNSWTDVSADVSDSFVVASLYKTQTTLGVVTAPSFAVTSGSDGFFYSFSFIGVNEPLYPQIRDIAKKDVSALTTVTFGYSAELDLFVKHFVYPNSTCWWIGGGPISLINDVDDTITPNTDRTWYLVGEQNNVTGRLVVAYAKAIATEGNMTSFTIVNGASLTGSFTIGQMVGVNSDHPISLFQPQDSVDTVRDDYTPITHAIQAQDTHVMTLFGGSVPSALAASSGYNLIDTRTEAFQQFSYATKSYETATTIDGYLTWTSGIYSSLNAWSFVLNPYGKSEKTIKPTIRFICNQIDNSTSARTIYNFNLKANDLVVFFGYTRGTSAQLNFATSLGTTTDILTKWDSTNGWNSYIKAILINTPVTSSWTVTQSASVGTGFNKHVTAVVFENVPPGTINILSSENVDNTSDTTLNLSLTLQKVGFAIAYNQASASDDITSPQWSNIRTFSLGYSGSYLTATLNVSPELTTNTTTFTGNSGKMYVHGITLPGWSLGSPLFFGSPF